MFETLLESGRHRSVPTPHAAISFTLHASALIGAIALTRASALSRSHAVPRVRQMIYIPLVASRQAIGASQGEEGASLPPAPVAPEWAPTSALPTLPMMPVAANTDGLPASLLEVEALLGQNGGGRIGDQRALSGVNAPPELLVAVPPVYPAILVATGVTGRVVLEFVVDSSGRFLESSLRIVSTDDPAFVEPARIALQRSRFRAARAGGAAVSAWVRQSIRFSLDSGAR